MRKLKEDIEENQEVEEATAALLEDDLISHAPMLSREPTEVESPPTLSSTETSDRIPPKTPTSIGEKPLPATSFDRSREKSTEKARGLDVAKTRTKTRERKRKTVEFREPQLSEENAGEKETKRRRITPTKVGPPRLLRRGKRT